MKFVGRILETLVTLVNMEVVTNCHLARSAWCEIEAMEQVHKTSEGLPQFLRQILETHVTLANMEV